MTPRTGRPKTEDPRVHIYRIRLSSTERSDLIETATDDEMNPSEWLREVALTAIEKAKRAKKRKAVQPSPPKVE